jgi:hypothetical protein
MRFSQRIGKRPIKTVLQVESIDEDLLNKLWTIILEDCFNKFKDSYSGESEKTQLCRVIWLEFFKQPIDTIPQYHNTELISPKGFISYLREWYDTTCS